MQWRYLFVSAFIAGNASFVWGAEKTTGIELGIAPFLPVKVLVQNYAPMVSYIEHHMKVPVTMVTAPDYQRFNERIGVREYTLIITVANSAYLAWEKSGYIPLFVPLIYSSPVMVVAHNQQLARVSELRGKSVAMADALAVVSMQGVQILRDAKLEPGRDVFVVNLPNHSAAINYVIAGELPAAIVSDRALMQLPQKVRDKVKVVQTWERDALPGVVYLVNPGLPREQREQLSKIILEYTQHNPEGLALMKRFGYGGLKTISLDEMRPLAPYGLMLKEAMVSPLK